MPAPEALQGFGGDYRFPRHRRPWDSGPLEPLQREDNGLIKDAHSTGLCFFAESMRRVAREEERKGGPTQHTTAGAATGRGGGAGRCGRHDATGGQEGTEDASGGEAGDANAKPETCRSVPSVIATCLAKDLLRSFGGTGKCTFQDAYRATRDLTEFTSGENILQKTPEI